MENEILTYTSWKTGEKITKELSTSHPSENKSGLICPFDGAEIIRWYDHMSKGYECHNCGIDYSGINAKNQEEVNQFAREYFQNLEKKLEKLKQRKRRG